MGVNIVKGHKSQKVLITRNNNLKNQYNSKNNKKISPFIATVSRRRSIISKGRRSIRLRKGGSAAAVQKPNAVSSGNNMAPALTEPLSTTEKLSSSAATATPSTRSSKHFDSTPASTSFASSSPTPTHQKQRRNINVSPLLNSTRVTRSNHAYQRVFEEAVTPIQATATPDTTKGSANSEEEPMGLNAAPTEVNNTIRNNNNNKPETTPSNIAVDSTHCKDSSTEQLLADLTNDFEEAITAEICLRKHFQDAHLKFKATTQSDVDDTKDILVIKAGLGGARTVNTLLPHMESETFQSNEVNPHEEASSAEVQLDEQIEKANEISAAESISAVSVLLEAPQQSVAPRLATLEVEELPPVSTDSTMTASEAEDNIEERLSQLDGSIVAPTNRDESDTVTSAIENAFSVVPATPPKTPTPQDHPQTQQQLLKHLQAQLQLTPPPQQVPHHSLTTMVSSNFPQGSIKESGSGGGGNSGSGSGGGGGGGGGGEIEDPDIDEVLCALKDFDGTSAGDTLCDLNVLLNEVYTTLNYEEINSQPTASTSPIKSNLHKDVQLEIEKKHQIMQRKIDFLLRRLRKLQARYMCKHTIEEIAGLFEWSARAVSRGSTSTDLSHQKMTPNSVNPVIASRPDANTWVDERKNPVPLAQMSAMLRKLQTVANAQQLCTEPSTSSATTLLRKTKKARTQELFDGTSPAILTPERKYDVLVPTLDQNAVEELTHVAGLLQSEMREVQNAIDSDATESSSGAESADEMVTYNNQIQQSLSIAKRAAWRYSRDRAAIASRWSWLHSQIADLEIKIRQHSELNQDVCRTKGAVVPCNVEEAAVVGGLKQHSTIAASMSTTSVNGYKGEMMSATLMSDGTAKMDCDTEALSSFDSCRTRGFDVTQFRKRKLLQTTNIHTISKKAARPSTIKCGCQWPLHPCAVCTGRVDPTAPRDLPDTMMMPDRVALLDPGFHPVLSFPEDINSTLHLEAIARMPDWQQRTMRSQVKSIAKSLWKAERIAAGHQHNFKRYGDPSVKRPYVKKKDRLAIERAKLGGSTNDTGNGHGTMSTTPLGVANKTNRNLKRLHCRTVGDIKLLEPVATNNSQHSSNHSQSSNSNYIYRTSNPLHQKSEQFNHNQVHSSLISRTNKQNNKHRKHTSTATTNHHHNNSHHHHVINNYNINNFNTNNNTINNNSNNNSYYNTNSNGGGSSEINSLHTNDSWDFFSTRSRTASPTHGGGGGSSNYHKYERSLDRKNRTSYDIDNIVIPYSVAAATRVEILHYKEIPTPKWRVIGEDEDENEIMNDSEVGIGAGKTVEGEDENKKFALDKNVSNGPVTEADIIIGSNEYPENPHSNEVEMKDATAVPTLAEKKNNIIAEVAEIEAAAVIPNAFDAVDAVPKQNSTTSNSDNVEQPKDDVHDSTQSSCIRTVEDECTLDTENTDKKVLYDSAVCIKKEEEDISNDAMIQRHERALIEERRKFQTYLKFPWSTRSRANRRIDSRAESSGANTPDPASPAPQTPSMGGGDQESIPSPLPPPTTLNSLDAITEAGENTLANSVCINNAIDKYGERRRTTSTKKEREMERRSPTPDIKEFALPYEPLKFPLSDEVFECLVEAMPSGDYQEDTNSIEDYINASIKPPRNRNNSLRNNGFVKRIARPPRHGDASKRRRRRRRTTNVISHKTIAPAVAAVSGATTTVAPVATLAAPMDLNITKNDFIIVGQPQPPIIENGKDIYEMEDDDEDAFENEEDDYVEEDEDDYPQHHLAPPKNDDYQKEADIDNIKDEAYEVTYGVRGFSDDGESSTTEPFQDDDPNDPEWKGESGERVERIRRKQL